MSPHLSCDVTEKCDHGIRPFECGICIENSNSRGLCLREMRSIVGKKWIGTWVNIKNPTKPSVFRMVKKTVFSTDTVWIPKTGEDRRRFKKERMWKSRRGKSLRRSVAVSRAEWMGRPDIALIPVKSRVLTIADFHELKKVEFPWKYAQMTDHAVWQYMRTEEEADEADAKRGEKTRIENDGRGEYVYEKYFIHIVGKYLSLSEPRQNALRQILVVGMKVEDVANALARKTGEDPRKLRQNLERQAERVRNHIKQEFPPRLPQVEKDDTHPIERRFQPYQFDSINFKKVMPMVDG
jgi:hypothetical protein